MSDLFGGDAASRIAALMVRNEVEEEVLSEVYPVSIRIPETMRAMLDAMAQQVGCSRNSMAIDLLRAGMQDVLSRLPPEVVDDLVSEAGGSI